MAISIDTIQQAHGSSVSSLSLSIGASSSNSCLVAFLVFDSKTSNPVSSITYGGQAMTLINSNGIGGGFGGWIDCYVLMNPPTGTQTLAASFASGGDVIMVGCSLLGTYQGTTSNSIGNNNAQGFNNASGPQSTSLVTTRHNSIALFGWFGWVNAGAFTTQTGGTTNEFSLDSGGGNGSISTRIDAAFPISPSNINDGWTTINSNGYVFSTIEIFAPGSSSSDTLFF